MAAAVLTLTLVCAGGGTLVSAAAQVPSPADASSKWEARKEVRVYRGLSPNQQQVFRNITNPAARRILEGVIRERNNTQVNVVEGIKDPEARADIEGVIASMNQAWAARMLARLKQIVTIEDPEQRREAELELAQQEEAKAEAALKRASSSSSSSSASASSSSEEASPTARAGSGSLRGLYRGHQVQGYVGPYLIDVGVKQRWMAFYEDGRVMMDNPIEGPEAFDPATSSVNGRYQVSGDRVTISLNKGKASAAIGPDGSFTFYGVRYTPMGSCDNLKLDAAYGLDWSNEFRDKVTLRFTSDGRFTDQGVLKDTAISSSNKYMAREFAEKDRLFAPGSGRYRIKNNTLFLDYSDGRRLTTQFYTEPGAAGRNPSKIFVAGYDLERK
jgi:hypothetical protein